VSAWGKHALQLSTMKNDEKTVAGPTHPFQKSSTGDDAEPQ
jgi:hypothetical protein